MLGRCPQKSPRLVRFSTLYGSREQVSTLKSMIQRKNRNNSAIFGTNVFRKHENGRVVTIDKEDNFMHWKACL